MQAVVSTNHFAGVSRRSAQGFTLIELLVVISVLAVLSALAAPSMGRLIASQRVRATAGDLQLTLMKARSEALKRNASVTVNRSGSNWNSGWAIADPGGSATALYAVTVANGLSVADSPAISQVVYNPNGRASAAVSFVVSAPLANASRCVSIDLTGRPYIKDGASC